MGVIARRTLREFWQRHDQAEDPLKAWYAEAVKASWSSPQDVKNAYRHAILVADTRVVFNIGGNRYRLIVRVNYDYRIVYVKSVGTHAEYDKIDPETI